MDPDVSAMVGGAWTEIRRDAWAYVASAPPNSYEQAAQWYSHPSWEVRMFAVLVLGGLAASDARCLEFLSGRCIGDSAWQVNEGLAMAFDRYCADTGYENALPTIEGWLEGASPNQRRAVSEGLRPWTAKSRPYFAAHPEIAIELLGRLRDDPSRYVQESVGNALRDIGRRHLPAVLTAVQSWIADVPASKSRRTIARFALKHAVKADPALSQIYG